jgi:iron complex transport system permease protein
VLIALLAGTFPVSARQVLESLLFPMPGVVHDVIWQLRMPRALAAFACGGLLSLAGVLLQVLLRNPLADPYILGISGGAALGALLAMVAGAAAAAVKGAAFAGALAAIVIVLSVGLRARDTNVYRLLLTGVVLSSGFAALVSLTLSLAPAGQLKGMLFWLMGDLSFAESPAAAWAVLLVATAIATVLAVRLDLLALGELKAQSLGVSARSLQLGVFLIAAAATVAAVDLAGTIGFVGLMVPHAVRLLGFVQHRLLVPFAILTGGSFLVLADTAARTVWAPHQLPVGVLTALFGVPAMLWLLGRSR